MTNLYIISGATGMTGNELSRQLVGRGDRVIGFDNFFASSLDTVKDILDNKLFTFYEYDINDDEKMEELRSQVMSMKKDYDKVIYVNCAAVVHTEHFYHIDRTFETNVMGMKKFLDQAIEVGADEYINCSTSEVYSMNSYKEGGVCESDFLLLANAEHSQRTSYAVGKLLTEFFMKDAVDKGQIKGCSIRFANVYSKNELYPKHILPHILTSLIKDGSVTLLENSKRTYRTFLDNEDSCSAVLCLMDTESALDGTVYNVGTKEEIHILDLVKLCAQELGMGEPVIRFEGFRASDPERRLLNTDKISKATGWEPKVTLRDGIRSIIKEMKS
ncbi:MAG: NAD(P)-dependent oxidoreductase [Candidatus Methanomethylophilaceae archaeon]|nr:NAD(P)-dependent oxidoreductase [Candidatus Methanomethylophilaceae archaeon]